MKKPKSILIALIVTGGLAGAFFWFLSPWGLLMRAERCISVADYSEAIDLIKRCVMLYDSTDAKIALMKAYKNAGRFDDLALFIKPMNRTSYFKKAIDRNVDHSEMYEISVNMARALRSIGHNAVENKEWNKAQDACRCAGMAFGLSYFFKFNLGYCDRTSIIARFECMHDACVAAFNGDDVKSLKSCAEKVESYFDEMNESLAVSDDVLERRAVKYQEEKKNYKEYRDKILKIRAKVQRMIEYKGIRLDEDATR